MRKLVIASMLFGMLSAQSSMAATSPVKVAAPAPATTTASATSSFTNTNRNDWSIAASGFGIGVTSAAGLTLSVSPQVEYFVHDGISVGGTFGFATATTAIGSTSLSVGPSATWHFWSEDKLSAYGGTSLIFSNLTGVAGSDVGTSLDVNGGVNYNFAPWFGVGPRVNYSLVSSAAGTGGLVANLNLYIYL